MLRVYCKIGDQELGPFSPDELKWMTLAGELSPDDFVRRESDSEWVQAHRLKHLAFNDTRVDSQEMVDQSTKDTLDRASSNQPDTVVGSEQDYTWLWVVLGSLIAALALFNWLGWTTVISIVLWIVVAGCTLIAVGCGIGAIDEDDSEERKNYRVVCGGAVAIAIVVWMFIPSSADTGSVLTVETAGNTSVTAEATHRYWSQLREITSKSKQLETQRGQASTLRQVTSVMRSVQSVHAAMAKQIRKLPIRDVDPGVVEYASELVTLLNDSASLARDFADFGDEVQRFKEHAGSFGVGLESFMRGFLGDPLGKYNELNAHGQSLESRRQQLLKRWSQLEKSGNAIDGKEMQLRSQLTRDYDREFPPLED